MLHLFDTSCGRNGYPRKVIHNIEFFFIRIGHRAECFVPCYLCEEELKMDVLSALAAALSLAADAMAVSVCCGLKSNGSYKKTAFITAVMLGAFQMLMPVLGWSIGRIGSGVLGSGQRIAAFLILLLLGIKMLFDARKDQTEGIAVITVKELLLLSVATSIDALALGTVLPVAVNADTPLRLAFAVIMIGAVTFVLSFGGFHFGRSFRCFRPVHAETAGGIILIILGIKVLIAG